MYVTSSRCTFPPWRPWNRAATDHLRGVASKVPFEDGVFLRWGDFLMVVAFNPLFWILSAEAAIFTWRSA